MAPFAIINRVNINPLNENKWNFIGKICTYLYLCVNVYYMHVDEKTKRLMDVNTLLHLLGGLFFHPHHLNSAVFSFSTLSSLPFLALSYLLDARFCFERKKRKNWKNAKKSEIDQTSEN